MEEEGKGGVCGKATKSTPMRREEAGVSRKRKSTRTR